MSGMVSAILNKKIWIFKIKQTFSVPVINASAWCLAPVINAAANPFRPGFDFFAARRVTACPCSDSLRICAEVCAELLD